MRFGASRDWFILVAAIVIGAILGKLQTSARKAGRVDAVSGFFHSAINAPATVLTNTANSLEDFSSGILQASSLKQRNRELESMARAAALYTDTANQLRREIDRLRKAIDLPPINDRLRIAADVIGYDVAANRIVIDVGLDKGLRQGLPVITVDGLVGVIQTVEKSTSQVTLIYSPTIKIGAIAQRDPPPAGLLHGESAEKLILEFVDLDAPVQIGDLVVTSGFSEKIPGGIPVGKIVQIENDKQFGSRRAQVFPNVQIGNVREVFVLR